MKNIISSVMEDSAAAEAGILPGEKLIAVDGETIHDVLDYMYFGDGEDPVFTLERPDGTRYDVELYKDEGEDAGLEFETYLMDSPRSCANRCIFCFVDQLPEGMRDTLYFKDDDVRLSFLTGSYITLTNLSEREIQRIIDLKISPINVSVHTMDPEKRAMMLGAKNGGKGVEIIKRLAEAHIEMNCQIVCCPGINDGDALLYTMEELAALYPAVNSVSVIPVGLTCHREKLFELAPYDSVTAGETINLVESFADKCLESCGSRIFFCSDEFYLKAGRDIHPDEYYEEYPQLENGVGLLRLLITEFESALEYCDAIACGTPFTIATGVSAAKTLGMLLKMAGEKYPNIKGRVVPIENDFFGHTIDVAGLITGRDLTNCLKGQELGDRVYITDRMLRDGGDVFLDDMSLEEASEILGVPVIPIANDGGELLAAMMA